MTRTVSFEETADEFVFICTIENQTKKVFKVNKETLSVSANQLFESMFSDLNQAPSFEFIEPANLEKTSKHVFQTVKQIVEKASEGIKQEWFDQSEELVAAE
ncbi:hypothetical protein ACTQZK_07305 [Paraeggerthella sp. LCP19S3_G8]|jgi:hypothetical protein|uniref:hypothetical protein n=1 Tax=Paraeggerthella sp. LCP19S3_G8 TaxID=3440248 RepID=UPI003F9D6C80